MNKNNLTIESFVNNQYKDYAKYVLHYRAIPNVIDGLKVSQRKALWTAAKSAKDFVKIAALTGHVISKANYHHGDKSMNDCISLMGAYWYNNVPLFEGDGNFGSRIITEPSAPRYIYVKLSDAYNNYFKDEELLPQNNDPESPEPLFYLPIIPWILVNGIQGTAVGHACTFQPYNPVDLKNNIIEFLKNGRITTNIKPYIKNFNGDIEFCDAKNKYVAYGKYKINKRILTITELPYGINRERYIKVLDKILSMDNSPIISYKDKSRDVFCFDIKLKDNISFSHDKIIKLFKLSAPLDENLTTIDENNKLKIFNSVNELIIHFCNYRIKKYKERYQFYIKRDLVEKDKLENQLRFVKLVINNQINFVNKSKSNLTNELKLHNIESKYINSCFELKIYNLTSKSVKELQQKIDILSANILKWNNIDIKKAWINDLKFIK